MTVKLRFHGASRTVTGSCYMIETVEARIMIDCGMFQGPKTERELNYRDFPFEPKSVHALLLTHAHIDHAGLIPKLVRHGFAGPIYCTPPTVDLCGVMLPDSGHIQESEARNLNERNLKRGLPEVEPLYTLDDAMAALANFKPVEYEHWLTPAKGIRARWWNAGHLLGSASIEVEVERPGKAALRILFSGDLGPDHKMLEADPEAPAGWDYVICESTYGDIDRFERSQEKRRELLASEVNAAAARRGVLLIPSFAVERTQEVVTDLVTLMEQGLVPKTDIFIDSPLANKASVIFRKHAKELEQGDALFKAFASPLVRATETVEDSKALNRLAGYHIVIAASGMAEAGRIRHHLKNNLWKPSTTVLLVGFQAAGTLGQVLESGADMVKIMGEDVQVKATIRRFEDYSGHADGPELVQWVKERLPIRQSVFLTHGEEEPQLALQQKLGSLVKKDCVLRPQLDDVYDLSGEACTLLVSESKPRIDPKSVARPDSSNEAANLHLDIDQELRRLSDEKSRAALLRRLKRALSGDQAPQDQGPRRRMPPRFGPSRRGSRSYDNE
jgi:metallo-beta-lactamase family protein